MSTVLYGGLELEVGALRPTYVLQASLLVGQRARRLMCELPAFTQTTLLQLDLEELDPWKIAVLGQQRTMKTSAYLVFASLHGVLTV